MSDVIGQNNATVDVPAVQEAVDAGGTVVLHGTFNFVNARLPAPLGSRVILVTGAVTIQGQDATIHGGGSATPGGQQAVLFIDAPKRAVTIEGLRFVNPHNAAIRVTRSGDLRIARCQVDGMTPSQVATPGGVQNAALAVHFPGGSVGAVSILENRFQIGGTADDSIGGIILTGPAERLSITENRITGTTSHGMDLRNVVGAARVERNIIETGPIGRSGLPGEFVDALRLIGPGEYVVERNQFDSGFENAAVVRLGATTKAVIRQNEVISSVAQNREPGLQSAGIQVQGTADSNEILENRINPSDTLQPTALVNEAYLRLVNMRRVSWQDRAHFFALAARSMRRILVDRARARRSAKRGGLGHTIALEEAGDVPDLVRRPDLVALEAALARLGQVDPRRSQVVELRYFGGLDIDETAAVLNVSRSTVIRDWTVARAWLFRELSAKREFPTVKPKRRGAAGDRGSGGD